FDGFEHHRYEDEVRQRWGDSAWERSNTWWSGLSDDEKASFQRRAAEVNGTLRALAEAGTPTDHAEFQAAVTEHYAWLTDQPGGRTGREYYLGLADMYVADDRFAAVYGGTACAERVREAIGIWVDQHL